MEREIAGKILSCLRAPSGGIQDDLSPSLIPSELTKLTERKEIEAEKVERMKTAWCDTMPFNIGFSFTQFLAQSVDGSQGIDLDYLEEYNYSALGTRKENISP